MAVNGCVRPNSTVALSGLIETVIGGMVIVAEFDPNGSATEAAVMVTVRPCTGKLAGGPGAL